MEQEGRMSDKTETERLIGIIERLLEENAMLHKEIEWLRFSTGPSITKTVPVPFPSNVPYCGYTQVTWTGDAE